MERQGKNLVAFVKRRLYPIRVMNVNIQVQNSLHLPMTGVGADPAGGGGGAVFAASIPDQMLDGNNGIIDVAETTGTITMSVMPTATPMNGNIGCIGDQQISRVQRRPSHGLAVRPKQRAGCGVGGEVTVLRQAVGIEHLAIFLRSRIRLIGCNFPGRTVYRGDVVEQVQIRWAVKFLQILSTRSFGLNDGEETRRLTDEATAVKEGG
mmetsp:Transcript_8124/g.16509  ORF Transcript_8124/g.16509 Transcript_8124/m.16509 type:complete len:208 (-) Transcript_8124:399-1022(-)